MVFVADEREVLVGKIEDRLGAAVELHSRERIMKPADLHAMGYNVVIYGITLLMRITRTMQLALEDLRSERLELVGSGVSFQEYMRVVDLDRWSAIETRFDVDKAAGAPRGGGT